MRTQDWTISFRVASLILFFSKNSRGVFAIAANANPIFFGVGWDYVFLTGTWSWLEVNPLGCCDISSVVQ